MADDVTVGAGAGGGAGDSGGGSSSPGVGGTSMTEAQISAPGGDIAFLNADPAKADESKAADSTAAADGTAKPAEEAAPEEVNLDALEEGQPEWLAKVADPAAKAEVQKLLEMQKAFGEKFKDLAEFQEFFGQLPGGKEQLAAMQTLVADVDQLDSAIEANTPEGNLEVASRYFEMAPDGGMGLLRAGAQHMAKANPEAWNQISAELINSTLHAAGLGFDLQTLVGSIREIKAAIAADDGDAWGAATGKLLGAPKAEVAKDPNLARASEREAAAQRESREARTESWQSRSEKSGDKINGHIAGGVKTALGKVLPASVSEKDRATLSNEISKEVMSQLVADPWVASQVKQLIGWSSAGAKGPDHSNANLKASQQDWDKATELCMSRANPKLIAKAVAKVVSAWSKDRQSANGAARDQARGAAAKVDVGAGKGAASGNGRKTISPEQMRARDERGNYVISDRDFLNS